MKTSRQKILDYFRMHPIASAGELSRAMLMTPANARHHINILAEQGALVQVGERAPAKGRGRPERIYRLAQSLRANNLGLLASMLLKSYLRRDDLDGFHNQLQSLAQGLAAWAGEVTPQRNLGPRLAQAVQTLNLLHYQARWEARPNAPEIYFGFCPYSEIIVGHPELCQMDAYLLQRLTGLPVEQTARLTRDREGGYFCRFLLQTQSRQ